MGLSVKNSGTWVDGEPWVKVSGVWQKATEVHAKNAVAWSKVWPNGVPGNDTYTKVLLHMDGTNGGTTFTDSNLGGVAGRSWTPGSGVTTSTASPKFGSSSGLFSASGTPSNKTNTLLTATSSDLYPGSLGAFSIDCWVNVGTTNTATIAALGDSNATNGLCFFFRVNGDQTLSLFRPLGAGQFPVHVESTAKVTANTWCHVYAAFNNGTYYLAVNGALNSGSSIGVPGGANGPLCIGMNYDGLLGFSGDPWIGYMDEFRYSVGTVRWTANFTPPAQQYV
jgi:hypothetical protein